MFHLHFTRLLRSILFLLIAAAVILSACTLWWANRTGLPDSWRAAIEREISQHGAYVEIGGLSFLPLRGVEANKVRVFLDPEHTHEISTLERVLLDFDKTKLARGIVRLNKLVLRDAALTLPLDPENPQSRSLEIRNANGTLLMPGGRRFEIRNASGQIAGIDLTLNARLTGREPRGESPSEASKLKQRRILLDRVIRELEAWHFAENETPKLGIFIEGNANDLDALVAKFTLHAPVLEKQQHRLDEVRAEGEIIGDLLTMTRLTARDARGELEARLDFDLSDRAGRFDLRSSLEIAPLLSAWFGLPEPRDLVIGGRQQVEAGGDFTLDEAMSPDVHVTGKAAASALLLRGMRLDEVKCAFSWRAGDLFLQDVKLSREDGEATGKAMIQWPLVRLALHTTLPAQIYLPLFKNQPLEKVITNFTNRQDASYDIRLEGGMDLTDIHAWAFSGDGTVKNVSYKNVPVNSAQCGFSVNHHELDFFDGTVVFNYEDYALRRAFEGPESGTTRIGRIRYVSADKMVEVENVTGTIWAAPLVRMFAPKVADSLESYRFHRPPALTGSGKVDVTPRGRTVLDVSFESPDAADYLFLGENLTLGQPSGSVQIRGPQVMIRDLRLNAFDGPVAGSFDHLGNGKLGGELSWTRLSVIGLASTYGFQMKGGGDLTGRIEFSLLNGDVGTMNGEGLFAIEQAELFAVPIFGPLSRVVGVVLNDRKAGTEQAESAFCNFQIRNGSMFTHDFQTSTTSLTFVGDGSVNLSEKTIDMTMRMNARGLLGLITLPLRPFYGMFQFRGTGPLKAPSWENVMFTTPSEEQKDLLQPAPKAKAIAPSN